MSRSLSYALVFCLLACGRRQGQPEGARPPRGTPEPLHSASDGELMGAQGQSVGDSLQVGATQKGLAPGWEYKHGRVSYDPEAKAGSKAAGDACPKNAAPDLRPDAGWKRLPRPECVEPVTN